MEPRIEQITVIDEEIVRATKPPTKTQANTSKEVRKAKFMFNKKGKLKENEMEEIRRTHSNIFDWMAPKSKDISSSKEALETSDEEGRELMEVLEREERLSRMEERKRVWETEFLCRGIIMEMVQEAEKMATRRMVQKLVLEIVDNASGVVEEVKE